MCHDHCNCKNCGNKEDNEIRKKAIIDMKKKRPNAFKNKYKVL